MKYARLLTGMFCIGLLLSGCGRSLGPEGEVSGKVTLKGKPLPGGQVTFLTPKGYTFTGVIDPQGNYKLRVPAGEARIAVDNRTLLKSNNSSMPDLRHPPGIKPPPGAKVDEAPKSPSTDITGTYVPLADKYRSPDASGLTYTVTTGSQTHDIEIPDR